MVPEQLFFAIWLFHKLSVLKGTDHLCETVFTFIPSHAHSQAPQRDIKAAFCGLYAPIPGCAPIPDMDATATKAPLTLKRRHAACARSSVARVFTFNNLSHFDTERSIRGAGLVIPALPLLRPTHQTP